MKLKPEKEIYIPNTSFRTPILFLIFNRPDTTKQVFSAIQRARPSRLYIAGDGSRPEQLNEDEICKITRSIATNVDWNCEVKTLFQSQHLGCRLAVSMAINWFFENEPEGIILEDDCIPSQSFFWFCQEILEQFRQDMRIGAISGFYSNEIDYEPSASYFFSRYMRVWGWAGWRRTFEGYDSNLNTLIEKNNNWKSTIFSKKDFLLKRYFQNMFDQVAHGKIDTWDTQLQYLLWQKKQQVIIPSKNLIRNIGWHKGAHSQQKDHNHELPTSEIKFPLTTPNTFQRDERADKEIELKSYKITKMSYLRSQIRKLVL